MWNNFFFIGLPYIAVILFIGGTIYRGFTGSMSGYRGKWDLSARGDYLWTTRSTGFFGRASIGPASLCLHWGAIILFVGHIVGFIGGAHGLAGWVEFFRWVGLGGGLLFCYGVAWAFVRRIVIPQVRAMSRPSDFIILLLLFLIAGFGIYQSAVERIFGISYSVGPWVSSIFSLQPDAAMMAGAPLVNKLHVIVALVFLGYLPFTKLVHIFSYPFGYIGRPFISVRKYVALKK